MATPRKSTKKKLDLSTAMQADGALQPARSVYEIVGIKNISYRERSFAAYQTQLRKMDLAALHDHSYEVGVPPGATIAIAIDRLETKYLQENPRERDAVIAAKQAAADSEGELSVSERAARIIARGR